MWGCAAANGPSTTAEHPVSVIQELFVQRSGCNGFGPARAQVAESGRRPAELRRETSDLYQGRRQRRQRLNESLTKQVEMTSADVSISSLHPSVGSKMAHRSITEQ